MSKMEDLKRGTEQAVETAKQHAETAEDLREKYNGVKEVVESIPEGLDEDIAEEIKAGGEEGKEQAIGEINTERANAEKAVEEGNKIAEQIQEKMAANTDAASKLETIRENRYGRGAAESISALKENTEMGKEAVNEARQGFTRNMERIDNSMKDLS